MSHELWRTLLGEDGPDAGCEQCFEEFHRYAEVVLAGEDAAALFPHLAGHLASCAACREDAEGILAALANDAEPGER